MVAEDLGDCFHCDITDRKVLSLGWPFSGSPTTLNSRVNLKQSPANEEAWFFREPQTDQAHLEGPTRIKKASPLARDSSTNCSIQFQPGNPPILCCPGLPSTPKQAVISPGDVDSKNGIIWMGFMNTPTAVSKLTEHDKCYRHASCYTIHIPSLKQSRFVF